MVLILDGNSEHVAHALRKLERKKIRESVATKLEEGGGGNDLVAGPLKRTFFADLYLG